MKQHVPRAPLAIAVVTIAGFVAQHLSGIRSGLGIDNVRYVLGFDRELVLSGQIWRIVTPTFLHISGEWFGVRGLPHIVVNILLLAFLGTWAERVWGAKRFVALYLTAGTVAFGWLVLPAPAHFFAGGASGALFGLLAALLIHVSTTDAGWPRRLGLYAFAAFQLVLNVRPLLGGPSSNRYAAVAPLVHLGGFVAGLGGGIVLSKQGRTASGST